MTQAATKRLTRESWLRTGRLALSETGPEALKAEPLARRLGTTKGSFYWHFEDVPAFHAALLEDWSAGALSGLETALSEGATDTARLRALMQAIATRGAADAAIRSWARSDSGAARMLSRVDGARRDAVQALLKSLGIGNPEMARSLYAAAIGMAEMRETAKGQNAAAIGSLVDLVLALR